MLVYNNIIRHKGLPLRGRTKTMSATNIKDQLAATIGNAMRDIEHKLLRDPYMETERHSEWVELREEWDELYNMVQGIDFLDWDCDINGETIIVF